MFVEIPVEYVLLFVVILLFSSYLLTDWMSPSCPYSKKCLTNRLIGSQSTAIGLIFRNLLQSQHSLKLFHTSKRILLEVTTVQEKRHVRMFFNSTLNSAEASRNIDRDPDPKNSQCSRSCRQGLPFPSTGPSNPGELFGISFLPNALVISRTWKEKDTHLYTATKSNREGYNTRQEK